jgi:hypothetical protein
MTALRPLAPVPDQPAPRRTRWTDAELMAVQFPEPRWAVPGLLCEGVNMLAGAPKLGKSWMSLGLGAAIANGDPALNSIDVASASSAPVPTPPVHGFPWSMAFLPLRSAAVMGRKSSRRCGRHET